MRCPTCKKRFDERGGRWRPFCSERCKLVDLGRWLDGSYAIPGEAATESDLEEIEESTTLPHERGRLKH